MVGFIFGGNTGETAESVARKRALLESLQAQIMGATPKTAQEGWGAVLKGIGAGIGKYRLDKQEKAGADQMRATFEDVAKGFFTPPGSPAASSIPTPDVQNEISGNSPAPAASVDISGSKQDFVNALLPAAIEEGKRTGVDPRIIVAQAAQETGWGKSAPGNNYFGIKSHGQAGGNSMMTTEVINGQPVRVRDSFRGYDSPEASVRGYGDFILQNPRYKGLREAQGLDAQLEALQASGYATDPNYSRSVGAIARGIQLPQEVASAGPMTAYRDPMVSQSPAAAAIEAQAPQQTASAPPLPPPTNVSTPPSTPVDETQLAADAIRARGGNPNVGIFPVIAGQQGETIAPAGNPNSPFIPQDMRPQQAAPAPTQLAQAGGIDPRLYQIIASPFTPADVKAAAQGLLQQQLQAVQSQREEQVYRARKAWERQEQQNDPKYQAELRKLEREAGKEQSLINAGEGRLYDPNTKTWISPPSATPSGKFRFSGNSVEAQALNGLIESGQITEEQAQQLGAGKTISGPNGEMIFMTPQGVFGQQAGKPPQPLTATPSPAEIDIFSGSPAAPAVTTDAPQPAASALPADPSLGPGMIPLTGPKNQNAQIPAEMGARIGLGDAFLRELPGIREKIKSGAATGPIDSMALRLGIGEPTRIWRDIETGRDALVRNLTGAGMPESEAQNQAARYQIAPGDAIETMLNKLDNLERDLRATRAGAIGARTGGLGEAPPPADKQKSDYKARYGLE